MLPLIDPYPLSGSPHPPIRVALAQYQGEVLPPIPVATSAFGLAQLMADDPDENSLPRSLQKALNNSLAYKQWKASMPPISQVPTLRRYRKGDLNFESSTAAAEIYNFGRQLPPEQVIFHGGIWPFPNGVQVGQVLITDRLLSTSLSPQVAAVHATYHTGGALWAIQVTKEGKSTPAFIYKNDRRNKHGHEYEVLLPPGVTLTCTKLHDQKRMQLIEMRLS